LKPTTNRIAALLTVLLLAVGCSGFGPRALKFNRNQYNMAVQQTSAQELLLNLVRLRYRDSPFFLQVASVSASLKLTAGIGATGEFPSDGPNAVTLDSNVALEESPTMTYTPLQGEQFVKQMLDPVELEMLLLLSSSGWSVERELRLLVQSLNGVPNAPTASGPTPEVAPKFERFLRVAHLLRSLQQRGLLNLSTAPEGVLGESKAGGRRIFLVLDPQALDLPETRELVEILRLVPRRLYYEIVSRIGPTDPERISVIPRSVTAAMFYASQSVEVPPEDEEEGRVTVTRDAGGERFDWSRLTGSLIRIRSGGKPRGAYVAVKYRGHWFYIEDSDLQSKTTFMLLKTVLNLQAGEVPSTGPVLTLPVAR
jgi:hypothetical protein